MDTGGLEHQATMNPSVKTLAVMFDPELIPDPGDRARILAVSPGPGDDAVRTAVADLSGVD